MKWVHGGVVLLGIILLITAAVKRKYRKKVRDIDGAVGVYKKGENVIGSEGDGNTKKKT